MKAVQKFIDCFAPARDLGGRVRNKDGEVVEAGAVEQARMHAQITANKFMTLAVHSQETGSLKTHEFGALTASEMAAIAQMPNDNKLHFLRQMQSPRCNENSTSIRTAAQRPEEQCPDRLPAAQPQPARQDAVVVRSPRLVAPKSATAARERTEQEIHNELVLETKLSPHHPALAPCCLLKQIGQGAFSKVYLAKPRAAADGFPPGDCVLKVVDLGADCKLRDDYKHILRAEGTWLSKFNQPGFVKCYGSWGSAPAHGSDEAPDHLVLALENLSGGMLLDRLKKGAMTEHHAAAAFYQLLTAIMFMHHMGYVHRDLKPDNVMLSSEWDPIADADQPPPIKLIDLGMVLNYVETPNACGLMGSPGYMSPEAIRGHRHTPAMDMFSLGVLLFVMLTGCKPLPSSMCTKLSYDTMEALDYPGLKMQQFKRLSTEAKDLVIALLQRRPQHRPSARSALQHRWLVNNQRLWRSHGVEIRYMAITAHAMKHMQLKSPALESLPSRHRPRTTASTSKPLAQAASAASQESAAAPPQPDPRAGPCSNTLPVICAADECDGPVPARRQEPNPDAGPLKRPALERTSDRHKENLPPPSLGSSGPIPMPNGTPASASPREVSPAALTHTIRNMLGLLQSTQHDPAPALRRGPPSAEAISSAIHAVVDAAKIAQGQSPNLLSHPLASMPPTPCTTSNSPDARQCAVDTAVYATAYTQHAATAPLSSMSGPLGEQYALPNVHYAANLDGQVRRASAGCCTAHTAGSARVEHASIHGSALTRAIPVVRLMHPSSQLSSGGATSFSDRAASAPLRAPYYGAASPPSASHEMSHLPEVEEGPDMGPSLGGAAKAVRPEARVTLRVTSAKALTDMQLASMSSGDSGLLKDLSGRLEERASGHLEERAALGHH